MLKDITLGQFFPGNSVLHRMDPRMKIILLIVYLVGVFFAKVIVKIGNKSVIFHVFLPCRLSRAAYTELLYHIPQKITTVSAPNERFRYNIFLINTKNGVG